MKIDLEVSENADSSRYRLREVVRGVVGADGGMVVEAEPGTPADGSAAATINTWFGVLLEGSRGRVKVRGDLPLIDACLTQLHGALWPPTGESSGLADSVAVGR